jgi:murein peptide amidase A
MTGAGWRSRAWRALVCAFVAAGALATATPSWGAPPVDERELLGESFDGRPIRVFHRGDPDDVRVLVVGCIHGDECAGVRIAERLRTGPPRRFLDLWILPSLNPDGRAAGTRQNARGVDLNRNFPRRWRRIGGRGNPTYSGTHPLSEPETRIARRLIRQLHPAVTIWFHQPLALVDRSGGDPVDMRTQRRFAELSGLPLRSIAPLPGTATRWQNFAFPGTTAFVVELPPGRLGRARLARCTGAVLNVAAPSATSGDTARR